MVFFDLQVPPPPPPLPEFPINWSSVGIRIETLLPVDPETLVNSMNEVGRPAFSMAIVDVNVLVTEVCSSKSKLFSLESRWAFLHVRWLLSLSILSDWQLIHIQELAIDPPTELGEKLKAAQVCWGLRALVHILLLVLTVNFSDV